MSSFNLVPRSFVDEAHGEIWLEEVGHSSKCVMGK